MLKKLKSISNDFTDKSKKAVKTLKIENPGMYRATQWTLAGGTIIAAAVASPLIPVVTAAVGGAAAVVGVGSALQSGLSRDMDQEMKTWVNLAGQNIRSTKEYELYFSQKEMEMLRLAKSLMQANSEKQTTKISKALDSIRQELEEFASDFKIIVVDKEGGTLGKSYKLLSNDDLFSEIESRTQMQSALRQRAPAPTKK